MEEEDTDTKKFLESEAPFSMNTFVNDAHGFRIQVTMRSASWETGVAEFEDMLGFLSDQGYTPADAHPRQGAAPQQRQETPQRHGPRGDTRRAPQNATDTDESWCPIHEVEMTYWSGKDGRTGWYSHKLGPNNFCRGRRPPPRRPPQSQDEDIPY